MFGYSGPVSPHGFVKIVVELNLKDLADVNFRMVGIFLGVDDLDSLSVGKFKKFKYEFMNCYHISNYFVTPLR